MGKKHESAAATLQAILAALAVQPMRAMQIVDALYPDLEPRARRSACGNVGYHLAALCVDGLVHQVDDHGHASPIYHPGRGVQPLAERDERDYAVERTPTDHGTMLVRFGARWRPSHAQGQRQTPGVGMSSIYCRMEG